MSANRNARVSDFVILGAGVAAISAGTSSCGSFLQGEIHLPKAHVEIQRQDGVNVQLVTGDELKNRPGRNRWHRAMEQAALPAGQCPSSYLGRISRAGILKNPEGMKGGELA